MKSAATPASVKPVAAAAAAAADQPQKVVVKIEQDHIICKVQKITLQQQQNTSASTISAKTRIRKRKERQESTGSQHERQERNQKLIRSNSEERPTISVEKKSSSSSSSSSSTSVENYNDHDAGIHNNIRRVSSSGDFPKSIAQLSDIDKLQFPKENDEISDKNDGLIKDQNNDADSNNAGEFNNSLIIISDDHEYEKRRSHERFARPHNFRKQKIIGRRYNNNKTHIIIRNGSKSKGYGNEKDISTKNPTSIGNGTTNEQPQCLKVQTIDYNTPTPEYISPISPVLDFSTTLQESINSTEPVLSRSINYQLHEDNDDNEGDDDTLSSPILSLVTQSNPMLLASPKTSIIAKHRIYMDPDIPNVKAYDEGKMFNPVNERIQKLNKLINSHKKKIKIKEADYEEQYGFKPSHFDKLKDGVLKKLCEDLCRYKKELKQLSDLSLNYPLIPFNQKIITKKNNATLQETINNIDQKLNGKHKENIDLESMTPAQLLEEKLAMQKSLLFLESVHGRVQKKEDRDLVRPYYDRYRLLKRMVAKINNTSGAGELATIHENEAMTFVTTTSGSESEPNLETPQIDNQEKAIENINGPLTTTVNTTTITTTTTSTTTTDTSTSSSTSSSNENIQSLSKLELQERLKIVIEEKKVLKRKIREFEIGIQNQTGRMLLTKEDKAPMEQSYFAYKAVKGRMKLLEALISK